MNIGQQKLPALLRKKNHVVLFRSVPLHPPSGRDPRRAESLLACAGGATRQERVDSRAVALIVLKYRFRNSSAKGKHNGRSVDAYAEIVGRPRATVGLEVRAARVSPNLQSTGDFKTHQVYRPPRRDPRRAESLLACAGGAASRGAMDGQKKRRRRYLEAAARGPFMEFTVQPTHLRTGLRRRRQR